MAPQGSFTSYKGLIQGLPQTASPGLRFLSLYIHTIDALDQTSAPINLSKLLAPSATFTTNGGDAVSADQVLQMFAHREKMLSVFSHIEHPISAFDLEHEAGRRTVICESVSMYVEALTLIEFKVSKLIPSSSVFKKDPDQDPAQVHEMLVLELEDAPDSEGSYGLWVTSAKTYMDPSPVAAKAKAVASKSGA